MLHNQLNTLVFNEAAHLPAPLFLLHFHMDLSTHSGYGSRVESDHTQALWSNTGRQGRAKAARATIALLVSLFVLAHSSAQTTYYIDPAGNDSASGTTTNEPFQTIQRGLNVVAPGDTIIIREGLYREILTNRTHGTLSSPITISAYSNETPEIRGSAVVAGWQHHADSIWKVTGWTNQSQMVFVDAAPLQMIGHATARYYLPVGLGFDDMMEGSFYHDRTNATLYVWLNGNSNPNNHTMEATVGDYRRTFEAGNYYIIDGITLRHSNVLVEWQALFLGVGSILRNSTVEWADFAGVWLSHNATVENCIIQYNGAKGIDSASSNVVVRNNIVAYNNQRGFNANTVAAGMKLFGVSGALVESNLFINNYGHALWLDFCRDDSLKRVIGNTITGTRPHPRQTADLTAAIHIEVSRNTLVANNLVVSNRYIGIQISEGINIRVYNNTIVTTEGRRLSAIEGRQRPRWTPKTLYLTNEFEWVSFTSNRVYNNLLYDNRTERDIHWPTNYVQTNFVAEGNTSDYNLFFRPASHPVFYSVNTTWTNLEAFREATGFDTNSLTVDPLLMSPGTGNYRLSGQSVAINRGITLTEISAGVDLDGNDRLYDSGIDLGAYEFSGSAEAIAPSVTITTMITPEGMVCYDTFHLQGINNGNVRGMIWAYVSENDGEATSLLCERITDTSWILNELTMETGIVYNITVVATNGNGTLTNDTITVERGGFGTGRPGLGITTPQPRDTLDVTFELQGTNNIHVVGTTIIWTNYYNLNPVASGNIPAGDPDWTLTVTGLMTGMNQVVIFATNHWGVATAVTTTVHHGETPIHYVDTNSPAPLYPFTSWETAARTIMDAVDATSDGDTIVVAPGLYDRGSAGHELGYSRVVLNKGITLESSDGPETTVIWGYKEGGPLAMRGVLMTHSNAVLRGFTIQNGRALFGYPDDQKHGGGLLATAMQTIEDCIFIKNTALPWGSGGGAMMTYIQGEIRNCSFIDNQAFSGGGLALWWGAETTADRLYARGNHALDHGGGFSIDNLPRFYNAIAWSNTAARYGGGISIANNSIIWNATIEENTADIDGGGIYLSGNAARLSNISAWSNTPAQIFAATSQLPHRVLYSIIPDNLPTNWITGINQYTNPLYRDANSGDFRLTAISPGLERGGSSSWQSNAVDHAGLARTVGPRVDVGAHEFWERIWFFASSPGYIPGITNTITFPFLWARDKWMTISNIVLELPTEWTIVGAYDTNGTIAINGNEITADRTYGGGSGNITAEIWVPLNSAGSHTITVSSASALSADAETLPIDVAPFPFILSSFQWLEVSQTGTGTVIIPTNGWVAPNASVTLTAETEPGWRLRSWLGDTANATTNANGNITISMDRYRSIQADFVELRTLTINSDFSGVSPGPGMHIIDRGDRITFDGRLAITNLGESYLIADWEGTGDVPEQGFAKAFSLVIDQDTSITWNWCHVKADHTSRGHRARGVRQATVHLDLYIDPDANVTQAWYMATLPEHASIAAVRGDGIPSISGSNLISFLPTNATGYVTLEADINLPAQTDGVFYLEGFVGINTDPGEPVYTW